MLYYVIFTLNNSLNFSFNLSFKKKFLMIRKRYYKNDTRNFIWSYINFWLYEFQKNSKNILKNLLLNSSETPDNTYLGILAKILSRLIVWTSFCLPFVYIQSSYFLSFTLSLLLLHMILIKHGYICQSMIKKKMQLVRSLINNAKFYWMYGYILYIRTLARSKTLVGF